MRLFGILLLMFLIQLLQPVFAEDVQTICVSAAVNTNTTTLSVRKRLEELLPKNIKVIYTLVPRGLVVSIGEETFFKDNSIDINLSGAEVLDCIVMVLKEIDNDCIVESHTEGCGNKNCIYHEDWELSMARANVLADYLVYCGNISGERVFPLGYGNFMPFRDSVSATHKWFNKRVDFVILDYEYSRD